MTESQTDVEYRRDLDEEPSVEVANDASRGDGTQPDDGDLDTTTVVRVDFSEWHGKNLVDLAGERIGKLKDVYFDIESDEPQFGTVKEGSLFVKQHLTFVPLVDVTIGPDYLQVAASRESVKNAPNIDLEGDQLSPAGESALYHHYELNYTPAATPSGRRLARR
jgi:sporulation protein YlmC with PRC-barrel domain